MGLFFVSYRAFVSHASSISKRFSDQKAIHQPGPKTVKHLTQMGNLKQGIWGNNGILEWWKNGIEKLEYWNDGRMEEPEGRDQRSEPRSPGAQ
jgi:hypothetical protein